MARFFSSEAMTHTVTDRKQGREMSRNERGEVGEDVGKEI